MDSYEIRWKRSAERELRNLDSKQISRIIQKVETLVKQLKEDPDTVFEITVNGASSSTQTRLRIGAKTPGW